MQEWIKKQRQTIVTGIVVTIVLSLWGIFLVSLAFPAFPISLKSPITSHTSLAFISLPAEELGQNALSPLATPTPTPVPQQNSGDNTFPAWLSFIGVINGALITVVIGGFGVAIYNNRRNAQIEQERNEAQRKLEQERTAAQLELERKRFEFDQERMRFQAQVEAEKAKSERERQRKEIDDEAAKEAMQRAKTTAEREHAYRELLQADPRIARMQILDMSHPMEVTNVFVRVRLHQEPKPSYELDPLLRLAAGRRDPNDMMQASHRYLESRSSSAIDPDAAIRRYKRCVFVGDPGAGKTTLLKYLALRAVEKQLPDIPDIPIHIELNAFATSGYANLLDFAATTWEDRYGFPKADARAYMEEKLRGGNAILLLDALDETVAGTMPEEAEVSYKRVWDAIMKLVTPSPIVVTARKAGYYQHARLTGFTELEVLDFRPEDIEQFVHNWFACSPKPRKGTNADDLNAKFARNARLQALAANPLLLSLIVIVYEDQLELPERRAELYKQCVDILLTKWDSSRDIRRRREFKPEHKRQLLAEVAWHFHCLGQRYFAESDLLNVIADFLPTIGLSADQHMRVLAEITAENGLLKEQAKHWYGFLHLTLQEYFTALYITDNQQLSTLLLHLGDPWWEEILFLYAGQTSDATPLFQELIGSDAQTPLQDDIFSTRLVLAGRCLTARPTIRNTTLRSIVIERLFEKLLQTSYWLTKEQVADTLAEIGGTEINERLLALLSNEQVDEDVREAIAEALGTLGEKSVVPALLALLSNEQVDKDVREASAEVLGTLGEKSVVPALLALLSNQQVGKYVRSSIPRALGTLGEKSVVPALLALLSNEQVDRDLRRDIAQALGTLIDDITIVQELAALLPISSVADYIHRALWEICRRMRVTIYMTDGQARSEVKIVSWE